MYSGSTVGEFPQHVASNYKEGLCSEDWLLSDLDLKMHRINAVSGIFLGQFIEVEYNMPKLL